MSNQLQSHAENNHWQQTQETLKNELSVILAEPVYSYDKPLISSIIQAFVKDNNISKIRVVDHRNQELGNSGFTTESTLDKVTIPLTWNDSQQIGHIELSLSSELTDKRIATSTANVTVSLLIFVVVTGIFIMVIINRVVVKPLSSVNKLLQEIAQGGGDLTKRINYKSNDEIGLLVTGFNQFIGEVQQLISEVAETSQGLDDVAKQVKHASEKSHTEANNESAKTEATLSHLEQLNAATADIAQNATTAATSTNEARDTSNRSREQMNINLQQVSELVSELDNTSNIVTKLNQSSDNISGVLDVIKSIAEQTNLLALNAAIEAARAGEQGRGFAVVADEVRTLAQRTQSSTKEIEIIIASLQAQAGESVSATNRSKELAELVIESTEITSTAMNAIADQMNHISDMNNMIASASEEQSSVTNEVRNTMEQIHKGAAGLVHEAEMLEGSILQLSDLETGLMRQIKQFKF
ncbi:methyl-accepting chemotaxis protein [Psychrosphaera algicola]|uniref:Methyl-accepting chemotaxis protein n=1 Tax=Psychrosphaera algicola TaxID=3023714 RepID=A0ABT5FEW1_9GAMM|nr:methyl-accepting chemotaxis protein [Psychrosphaera sp. G1-22]MDC2889162.1 methyl-accepting chemotaxis protein [Psychrosphaera sp. G1-22]